MQSVAILAGGDARRFGGRDKGALVVDGRTILERQISELSTVTPDVRVIRREDDLVPGCGPLGGLHAALNAARGDALFLVACDMPFVTAALAAYLLTLAGDADAVVPRLKMLDLLHDLRVREVTADDLGRFGNCDRLLANVNTPAEYASLEALQGHKK